MADWAERTAGIRVIGPFSLRFVHQRPNLALHVSADLVFSLVERDESRVSAEDIFVVNFIDHYHWELKYNEKILMRVRYEQPYLPMEADHQQRLEWNLPRIFPDIDRDEIERIKSLVLAAEGEAHGTMLVVSADAESEARRLSAQATLLDSILLSSELLPNLTPIDGAVMLDHHGNCYAIGVILDGMASESGDGSRGARFNSALRYIDTSKSACLAVVISEDGGVDVLPNIRAPIARQTIVESIDALVAAASGDSVNRRQFNMARERVSSLEFYLLEADCEKANRVVESTEAKMEAEDPMALRIVRDPFKPNAKMDPDFYYLENIAERRGHDVRGEGYNRPRCDGDGS